MSTRPLVVIVALVAALLAPDVAAHGAPEPPSLSCESCLVADEAGTILFRRGASRTLPNASTTKTMTALVVRSAVGLEAAVTVSAGAAATVGGGLALMPGQTWTVEDLLHALLLSSSNDAAVALAERVSGTHGAFVTEMNARARRMGLNGTNFVTAHGLDAPGHHSTARDLATLGAKLLEDPELASIVAKPSATLDGPEGGVLLENRNLLLESYRGATGIKTGYTLGAGNVLVASAERNNRRLIAVALRADDATGDARALLDYGFGRLRETVLLTPDEVLGSLTFDPSGSVGVRASAAVKGIDSPAGVEVVFEPRPDLSLPISEGEVVGRVTVDSGGTLVTEAAVATESLQSVASSWPSAMLGRLLSWGHVLTGVVP